MTNNARGTAWFDVDNDGDWDIYVTRGFGGNLQDYVFINDGDGTVHGSRRNTVIRRREF